MTALSTCFAAEILYLSSCDPPLKVADVERDTGTSMLGCPCLFAPLQGDLAQAQACTEEILNHLKAGSLYGADEPFRVYLTCYRVLRAAGDARAQAILETAHCLLQERAARISDEKLRHSFLENVAAHREIVQEVGVLA